MSSGPVVPHLFDDKELNKDLKEPNLVHLPEPLTRFNEHCMVTKNLVAGSLVTFCTFYNSIFLAVVEWNERFDIGKILAESGINPGKSFSGKTIMTAIEAVTGKTPGYQSYGFATPLSM